MDEKNNEKVLLVENIVDGWLYDRKGHSVYEALFLFREFCPDMTLKELFESFGSLLIDLDEHYETYKMDIMLQAIDRVLSKN